VARIGSLLFGLLSFILHRGWEEEKRAQTPSVASPETHERLRNRVSPEPSGPWRASDSFQLGGSAVATVQASHHEACR
jgi:hypothetical protein